MESLHLVLEEVIELSNIMGCIDLVVVLARVGGGVKLGDVPFLSIVALEVDMSINGKNNTIVTFSPS